MEKNELMMTNPLISLGLIKDKVSTIFMLNEDITSLTMPILENENYSFEENWLGRKIESSNDKNKQQEQIIGHFRSTPYFDETIIDTRTMIMIETYINKMSNSIIDYTLTVNVVSHKDGIEIPKSDMKMWNSKGYYGNRVDMICMAIYKALTDLSIANRFGIGKIELNPYVNQMQSFRPNNDFYGRTLSFRIDEIKSNLGDK